MRKLRVTQHILRTTHSRIPFHSIRATTLIHWNRDHRPGSLLHHYAILDYSTGAGRIITTIAHTPDIVTIKSGPLCFFLPPLCSTATSGHAPYPAVPCRPTPGCRWHGRQWCHPVRPHRSSAILSPATAQLPHPIDPSVSENRSDSQLKK